MDNENNTMFEQRTDAEVLEFAYKLASPEKDSIDAHTALVAARFFCLAEYIISKEARYSDPKTILNVAIFAFKYGEAKGCKGMSPHDLLMAAVAASKSTH